MVFRLARKIASLLLVFSLFLWIPALAGMTDRVSAQEKAEDFSTSYDVAYDVEEDGTTTVTEKITLKNLTSQYYATQFKLTIGATQISDVKASDPSGPIVPKIEQKGTTTNISVKFNQQVVGLGKELPWTLQYTSKDFAVKQGKVWEVTVPKVSSSAQLDNYEVTLSVPLEFGEPTLITPVPQSQTTNFGKMFLTFDKEQLKNSGISATFGASQLYDFDLTYHLENKGLVPILTHIALPPDTNYQDVIYQRIDPKPINVTVDVDGNYLAWYRLNRGQKVDVKAIGSAKLFTKSKVANPTLTDSQKKLYTSPSKYWESDNTAIKNKLAEILKGYETAPEQEKVQHTYKYVVNVLRYDSSRLNDNIARFGSVTALNNPTEAVCMEFTDLFIALSRAAGIPARELDGFAYTNNATLRPLSLNRDVLHAWPEYWDDKKGWVMVDPTWENTTQGVDYFNKLDLNHFVFAIKGASSELPVPAGSYKYMGQDSRDVKVTLSDIDFLGKPQIDVGINVSSEVLAGFPGKFTLRIDNQGNAPFYPTFFSVSSDKINIFNGNQSLGVIPPFGHQDFEYDFRTKSFFDSFSSSIKVGVNNQTFDKGFLVKPFFVFKLFPFVFFGIILGMVAIYLSILGALIYRKRVRIVQVIPTATTKPKKAKKQTPKILKRTFFKRK